MSTIPILDRGAVISDCGRYRYLLRRKWEYAKNSMLWIMLNPSTADADTDDATIRRCMHYAFDWGYGGINVVNLFAYRSTQPKALRTVADPVGPDNDTHIIREALNAELVVAAWGAHGNMLNIQRDRDVYDRVAPYGVVYCLGTTKQGQPKHPVRLGSELEPRPFVFGRK